METPNNLFQVESKDLAAYIVLYRALGFNKELALLCMQELSNRRSRGEIFEFEKFIDEELAKIPKPVDAKTQNIISFIGAASKGKVIK